MHFQSASAEDSPATLPVVTMGGEFAGGSPRGRGVIDEGRQLLLLLLRALLGSAAGSGFVRVRSSSAAAAAGAAGPRQEG